MRLTFNPVAGPNFSGISSAVSASGRNVADGLSAIGDTVTNLGKRRQARAAAAKQEADARALENFKLGAVNADAAALSQIALSAGPGGQLPVGAADFIAQRQTSLLSNDSIRAGNESTRAGTRGQSILNNGAQLELDNKQAANAFQNKYGADIVAANNLANQGRGDEAQAVLDRVLGAAAPEFGSDAVLSTIDAVNARTTAGDNARTGVLNNATSVLQREANLTSTNIANNGSSLRNRIDSHNFNRGVSNERDADAINAAIARHVNGATSTQDALVGVQNDNNLTAEQRLGVAAGVNQILGAPGALDTHSPIDPLNQNVLDIAKSNPSDSQVNFSSVADFVAGASDAELKRNSSQQLFRRAEEISPDVEHVDIAQTLAERYPDRDFSNKDLNRIDKAITDHGLTRREAIAAVDDSVGARGLGISNILPGGKRADDRVFKGKTFDNIIDRYINDQSQGNLQVDRGQRQRDTAAAEGLKTQYDQAVAARARAVQSGDTAAIARYDQILSNLNIQARSLETQAQGLETRGRNIR